MHARHIKAYRLVNALAAAAPADEERILAADPAVARVIPDSTIRGPAPAAGPRAAGEAESGSEIPYAYRISRRPQ